MSFFDSAFAPDIWAAHFSFDRFDAKELAKKLPFWRTSALAIAEQLSTGKNTGVRLATAGGKTIIAFLASAACGYRVLFLSPTKTLARQHDELQDTLQSRYPHRLIIGETSPKKRVWNKQDERFVFATPEAFLSDWEKDAVDPDDFDLVILDEFHHATGNYAYVAVAGIFHRAGVRILGLSASPAETKDRLEAVKANCHLDVLLSFAGALPPCRENFPFITPSRSMLSAERLGFMPLFESLKNELKAYGLELGEKQVLLSIRKRNMLKAKIGTLPKSREWYRLVSAFAAYEKLLYAHRTYFAESYATFLAYVEKLRNDESRAAHRLLAFKEFHRLIVTAETYREEHPKAEKLMKMLRPYRHENYGIAIVFFGDKLTALYFKERLLAEGVPAETVFGGRDKNVRKQRETIDKLHKREIRVLLATSVIEEGLSIPEVDWVIDYSLPQTAIARLQRAGRTGRMHPGSVTYLILDHPLDRIAFFSVHRRQKNMKALYEGRPPSPPVPKRAKPQIGRKRRRDEYTLPLFADGY